MLGASRVFLSLSFMRGLRKAQKGNNGHIMILIAGDVEESTTLREGEAIRKGLLHISEENVKIVDIGIVFLRSMTSIT